jgi:hypothetical protein
MKGLREIWQFLKERRKFWLAPVILFLLLLGVFLVFSAGSSIAPFIYSLF